MDKLQMMFQQILDAAREIYGPARFKYQRVPHSYRKGRHWIACVEHPEVSRDEYLKNKQESERKNTDAFMGRNKESYDEYRQTLSKEGYLQQLKKMIETEIIKEKNAPAEDSGSATVNVPQQGQPEKTADAVVGNQ
jgi:hypothetical protein